MMMMIGPTETQTRHGISSVFYHIIYLAYLAKLAETLIWNFLVRLIATGHIRQIVYNLFAAVILLTLVTFLVIHICTTILQANISSKLCH